mmetsp:Transcript_38915/g.71310  ORF Transcript_38915/g.71310 Transcript_38915/m.71310 type:complete len:455 (+) Transcript_38915:128-1492(+)
MENIQTAEETSTLSSPKRRIAQAYSINDKKNSLKKYSFWMLAFFAFLVFSVGSGSGEGKKQKRAKKLRNNAETMPEVEVEKLQHINNKIELNEKYAQLNDAHAMFEDSEDASLNNGAMEDEDDLDREVERVFGGVDMAEEDEIDSNNSMLTTAVKTMEESVKFYLGRVFGYGEDEDDDDDDDDTAMTGASADVKLTEEQLEMIAKKISDRLDLDVKSEFRAKADSVKEKKVSEIQNVVAEDRDARMNARQIERDVHEAENVVLEDLRDEIDEAADRVKEEIPEKLKKIRNEVVEEVTGKKLDDIERQKRARKEKKQELVKKFQEMRAKAKEAGSTPQEMQAKAKEARSKFQEMRAKAKEAGGSKPQEMQAKAKEAGSKRQEMRVKAKEAEAKKSQIEGESMKRNRDKSNASKSVGDSKSESKDEHVSSEDDPKESGPSVHESNGSGDDDRDDGS